MFSRFLVVALASLALACGISLISYRVLGRSDGTPKVKTRNVVVATTDLAVGAKIRPQDIRIMAVPADFTPQNCFEKVEEVNGRLVINSVLKGEPVVSSRLASPGSMPGLAPMIPAGYRAVSVRVNDVIGVAGFIQPGMRVDVLASGRLPNSQDSVTRTVLQNVVVLSAGQVLQPEPKGQVINAQVVTLQVRPEEAEILALTSGEGRIQLVLRNSSDTAVAMTSGARLTAVYNVPGAPPQPPEDQRPTRRIASPAPAKSSARPAVVPSAVEPGPERKTIEVIRGTTRSDVTPSDPSVSKETEKNGEVPKRKATTRLYARSIFA